MNTNEHKGSFSKCKIQVETMKSFYEFALKEHKKEYPKFATWIEELQSKEITEISFRDVLNSGIESDAIVTLFHVTNATDAETINNDQQQHLFVFYLTRSVMSMVDAVDVRPEQIGIKEVKDFNLFTEKFIEMGSKWDDDRCQTSALVDFINFMQTWKSAAYPPISEDGKFSSTNLVSFIAFTMLLLNPHKVISSLINFDEHDQQRNNN
jgi:hypothetical protein